MKSKISPYFLSQFQVGTLSHTTNSIWTHITVPLESTLGEAPFKLNLISFVCMAKVSRGKSKIRDGHGEVEKFPKIVECVNLKIKGLPK